MVDAHTVLKHKANSNYKDDCQDVDSVVMNISKPC